LLLVFGLVPGISCWVRERRPDAGWQMQQMSAEHKLEKIPEKAPFDHMKDPLPGAGVNIYVIDSGINRQHSDFARLGGVNEDRVVNFEALDDDNQSPYCEPEGPDCTMVSPRRFSM
jgi:hypothetical protein